jgi:hypothetical protein
MVVKEFYIYRKKKLREISVSFWSDVLLCLSEAKPHTDSSVNDILSSDILNFSSLNLSKLFFSVDIKLFHHHTV